MCILYCYTIQTPIQRYVLNMMYTVISHNVNINTNTLTHQHSIHALHNMYPIMFRNSNININRCNPYYVHGNAPKLQREYNYVNNSNNIPALRIMYQVLLHNFNINTNMLTNTKSRHACVCVDVDVVIQYMIHNMECMSWFCIC